MTVLYKLAKEQLSKQFHYDFGLRALKSVLVMAGELKRGSPDLPEVSFQQNHFVSNNMCDHSCPAARPLFCWSSFKFQVYFRKQNTYPTINSQQYINLTEGLPPKSRSSVANTAAKPRNWATFDPAAAGKKLAPRFADPITVNVILMGWPEIGLLETLAPRIRRCLRRGLAFF